MQRVSMVEKEQAHPLVKEVYEKNEAITGRILNPWKVMGHCPYIGLNFQRMGNSLLTGEELPHKLREIAVLRVGYLTQSEYELRQHTPVALRCGVSQKQIDDIADINYPRWKIPGRLWEEVIKERKNTLQVKFLVKLHYH